MLIGSILYLLPLVSPKNSDSTIVTSLPRPQSINVATSSATPNENLSPDTIFKYIDPETQVKNNNLLEYTIIATGDVIPARSVNAKLVALNNFNYPFQKTMSFLKSADAVFINLESPLISKCKPTVEGMSFCGDEKDVQGLVYAGVTVASIANNHAGNYGLDGVNETVSLLKKNNISVAGNIDPAIITIKDKKFGFLGYNDIGSKEAGIAWADISYIQKDVKDLKKQVDFVIVTFHWGIEYTLVPNRRQVDLSHSTIDAGADLIIGNHPHWVQGIEEYKGKYITYAHGNYVFDQMWSQETREGVLGKYTFNKEGLKSIYFFPIIIDDYSQPRFATEKEANKILARMQESTKKLQKN